MRWTWDKLIGSIEIEGERRIYSDDECNNCMRDLGFKKLPESYREYMKRLGLGEWDCELFICVPGNDVETATLSYKVRAWERAVRTMQRNDLSFIRDPKLRAEAEQRPIAPEVARYAQLIQFGGFGNGYCIYWDKERICPNGDMEITIANARDHEAHDFHGNLLQFLGEAVVEGKLNDICNEEMYEVIKPIFRARFK